MYNPVKSSVLNSINSRGPQIDIFLCAFDSVAKWGKPVLRNSYWRCYLPITNGATLRSPGKAWPMRINEMFIIPPDCSIQGDAETPFTLYYTHFNCSIQLLEAVVYTSPVIPEIRAALDEAAARQNKHLLGMAMLQLISSALDTIPERDIQHPVTNDRTTRAYLIMKEHLHTRLDNRALARQLNLSEASLLRLFRTTTGRSPQKEHLRLRLNHAAELLRNTNESIDWIAEACGFWDRNHFTRVFTQEWKIPPARYRHSSTAL
jgi:AraC-like DNA-binding protein